ncbi:MAG TPA: aldo/keto reductase [Candidatus Margulisiibacteriota bacterium]|nr:aldo/keto reductase [Candidatus Margulisiibacteriota bacterium]
MDVLPISPALRPLGQTSLRAFPIAYGSWRFAGTDVRTAREKIETAVEVGINLFDHADIYGGNGAAEELFGHVLAEVPHLRDAMLIATKGGIVPSVPYDSSREHLLRAAEGSLRRLRIDVIDLYHIHRPDLLAHPQEMAAALTHLRDVGKIREVGVSNFTSAQFDALQSFLPFPIATHQLEMSAWWLEPLRNGLLDQGMRERVTPLAWSPLAGGHLGLGADAARTKTNGERLAALIECLDRLAERESVRRSAIALAFLLVHPAGIVPIIGTQRPERIRDSLAALHVRLTRADWYEIVVASQRKRLP